MPWGPNCLPMGTLSYSQSSVTSSQAPSMSRFPIRAMNSLTGLFGMSGPYRCFGVRSVEGAVAAGTGREPRGARRGLARGDGLPPELDLDGEGLGFGK